ncbi:MAG: hypothetical protein CL912_00700 [Deltaproteobacteria bacterium]|nr:hypothetical protein [Deltaproteobacteria bacterium]
MTGGIVDIGGLYDCLIGIYEEKTDPSILDKYSEIRSKIYKEIIDPVSSENIRRLFDQDPDAALDNDEFLKMCKRTATDLDYSRELQLVSPNNCPVPSLNLNDLLGSEWNQV